MLVVAPHRRFVAAAALCVALVLCALAPEAMAAEDARFEVRSAYLEPVDGVMQLNATLELGLSATALEALRDGVPVTLTTLPAGCVSRRDRAALALAVPRPFRPLVGHAPEH